MARRGSDAVVLAGAAVTAARVLRRDFSGRVFSRFASVAMKRGMRSGSPGWLYAAAASTGIHYFLRFIAREEEVLAIKLRPGDAIEVRHLLPPAK
jgi:hypothetical protein